ncbi:MAG TPA: hypothetical protein VFZ68_15750 [Acidimicrobiales bacterium]
MVTTLVQLGRTAARPLGLVVQVGRNPRVRRVVGLVLVVVAVRSVAGVWPAALVGAVVVTLGLLVAWAAVERRVTERARARPPVVEIERGPRDPGRLDGEHVAFAQGLAGLAAWYLAECEREAQR